MSNDMIIIITIVVLFLGMGAVLPFVASEFDPSYAVEPHGSSDIVDKLNSTGHETNIVTGTPNVWNILISMMSMFLWTFGAIPFWIDLAIFVPCRILLVLTISRNIWIGGGG